MGTFKTLNILRYNRKGIGYNKENVNVKLLNIVKMQKKPHVAYQALTY